eukprot:GSMAST32.ASY1.ANO1.708.1 assembled CDS
MLQGVLFTFGRGDYGKLGHGNPNPNPNPRENHLSNRFVPSIVDSIANTTMIQVASFSTHSVAAMEIQLKKCMFLLFYFFFRRKFSPVKDVACGLGHTLVLLTNSEMYAWGDGSNGRLGLGDTTDRPLAC